MACNDRQLTQAQREAGYNQMRTAGVVRAPRPFSGQPTIENLIDYLNREVYQALRDNRNKVNDVYRQVTDNAPSANPLGYYFSTETANADPTDGRLRLNSATQNAATVVRLSQANARLQDAGPWLDVMAGSSTTPLGTITLTDAIDPLRFIRWDLTAMVDNGAYWDLTVSFVESSHDNPFVDGQAVVCGFIPGVASTGATVPFGSLPDMATDTFLGNISGATAAPAPVLLADVDSTSITYDAASHTFQRPALTGFAAAAANSNATTSAEPIVTFSTSANMSAERVLSNGTNTTVSTAVANQISITVDDFPLSGLADIAAGTQLGRQIDAGTGVPVALTGLEQGENIRFQTTQTHSNVGAGITITLNADANLLVKTGGASCNIIGITGGAAGRVLFLRHTSGGGSTTTIEHDSGSTATDGILCPGNTAFTFGGTAAAGGGTNPIQAMLIYNTTSDRWILFPRGMSRAEPVDWTGSHSFAGSTFDVNVSAAASFVGVSDMGIGSTGGGLSLGAGAVGTFIFQSASVGNGDVVINASDGVAITAGLATGTATATADTILLEADNILFTGSAAFNQRMRFNSILSTSIAGVQVDNLDVSTVNMVRVTGTGAGFLTGMVAGADGQVVHIVLTPSTGDIQIVDEGHTTMGTASSAANRFQLSGSTSQSLGVRGSITLWYDGTSDRWREIN